MIVRETSPDSFEPISGNPTLDSLDGEQRAPLQTILSPSWSDEDRAAFGVFVVADPQVPAGSRIKSVTFQRTGGKVVAQATTEPAPDSPFVSFIDDLAAEGIIPAGRVAALKSRVKARG